jgi:hypothetical protein
MPVPGLVPAGSTLRFSHSSKAAAATPVVPKESVEVVEDAVISRFADEGYKYLGTVELSRTMYRKESTLADAGVHMADAIDQGRPITTVQGQMIVDVIRATSNGHVYIVQ